ncbi:multidrug and toxin extrusion 2-like [Pelobates cultripes]|uniref:Multidrug and toxin extrusion 2-like n=1 Tax=Pelobates cultripes TaxID=61616 RepID=A0AAD1VP60_PELCU|nr:multidrug and toxin extrusion 2-like [Pelobates cultripes]
MRAIQPNLPLGGTFHTTHPPHSPHSAIPNLASPGADTRKWVYTKTDTSNNASRPKQGWSRDCLQEWKEFMLLAIPSMFMVCIEWWSYESGAFLSGAISVVELGAQSVMLELSTVAYLLSLGFAGATSVRVGIALGAGDVKLAIFTSKVSLFSTGVFALLTSSFIAALHNHLGYVFTTDSDILFLVSRLLLILAPLHILDALNCLCGGILQGSGKQTVGAVVTAVGHYIIGLPLGIGLMFGLKLGVIGLWSGMMVANLLQVTFFVTYILRMNWSKACEEAQIRAGLTIDKKDSDPNIAWKNEGSNSFGMLENGPLPNTDIGNSLEDNGSPEKIISSSDDKQTDQQMEQKDSTIDTTNVVGELLSVKQLILWRGLAVLAAVLALSIGIIVKCLTSKG